MSMNKIKTRHAKRAMHVKRRGKHTTHKGYRKYRKHHTRKYGKRTQGQGQGQGKGRLRKQRQTRRKVGGFSLFKPKLTTSTEFNFVLPSTDPRFQNIQIQGKGWAYVTKLGSFLSQSDRPEQLIIFKTKNEREEPDGNYFIARCVSSECSNGQNMESKILEITGFDSVSTIDNDNVSCVFTTSMGDKYKITFTKPHDFDLKKFKPTMHDVKVKNILDNYEDKKASYVKVRNTLGMFEDRKASCVKTGITKQNNDYDEDTYTLSIDGKEKVEFFMSNIKAQSTKFKLMDDDKCYRPYTFTDISSRKSIEVYVPALQETDSMFDTIEPELARDHNAILCDDGGRPW